VAGITSNDTAARPAGSGLVVLGPAGDPVPAFRPRPLAGFVTQLIACVGQVPAYRARRRAEPHVAAARYAPAAADGQRGFELSV
jgi:hypothetical protein